MQVETRYVDVEVAHHLFPRVHHGMPDSSEVRAFPQRLHHAIPAWVKTGAIFHIRLRVAAGNHSPLTQPHRARFLLNAAQYYHNCSRWHCLLFLIMPDHLHALIVFPSESQMGRVVGEWKKYLAQQAGIEWQPNYFDHRIRSTSGFAEKYTYIRRNPVVKGLCANEDDWAWRWIPDREVSSGRIR